MFAGGLLHCSCYFFTAIDYIFFLQKQSANHAEELERLQREVKALEIMKEYASYSSDQLSKANISAMSVYVG